MSIGDMATLASQLVNGGQEDREDQEQLKKLFWNRAELKKEFDRAREEADALGKQLKEERATKLRLQQKLEQLEAQLANSATAAGTICYFQLRDIWNRCHARLTEISEELAKAHRDREYRQHLANHQRELGQSLSGIRGRLDEAVRREEALVRDIELLQGQHAERNGIWYFFLRRKMSAEINLRHAELLAVQARVADLTEELRSRSSVAPPDPADLDVAAKRLINLTVIAYAQELYLHFADDDLADRAREAAIRQFNDVIYGDKRDSRALSRAAELKLAALEADSKIRRRAHARVEFLRNVVEYRSEHDTIPIADMLNVVVRFNVAGEECGFAGVNILADEYWDVFSALIP